MRDGRRRAPLSTHISRYNNNNKARSPSAAAAHEIWAANARRHKLHTADYESELEKRLTMEVALGAEVADCEPQDRQPIQLAQDVLLEGKQAGQSVQFGVQPLPMSFARVALRHPILWWRFYAASTQSSQN
jgi:hypothetical protein